MNAYGIFCHINDPSTQKTLSILTIYEFVAAYKSRNLATPSFYDYHCFTGECSLEHLTRDSN